MTRPFVDREGYVSDVASKTMLDGRDRLEAENAELRELLAEWLIVAAFGSWPETKIPRHDAVVENTKRRLLGRTT